jgi:membrane protease YdiL (CAAX protease family)
MENSEIKDNQDQIQLPFNNLFLNAGFVSGSNKLSAYIFTFLVTVFAYFSYQVLMLGVLVYMAQQNGMDIYDTQALLKNIMNPDAIGVSKNFMLALLLGMFAFTFLSFYFSVKKIHGKTFLSVITSYPKIRWNQIFFAFGVWSSVLIVSFLIDYLWLNPEDYIWNFDLQKFLALLILSVVFIPIQSSFEEIFFRGYLMQGISIGTKNGVFALVFTSLLFGLAHMSNPEAEEYGAWIMLPYYSLFGLFLGLLALWNNGLELSIGIHVANNLISSLLVTSKNTVLQTDALFVVKQDNVVNEFFAWMVMAFITYLIFQYKYKFKNHLQLLK